MTPKKKKTDELIDKFSERRKILTETKRLIWNTLILLKQREHALVAVDELIKIHYLLTTTHDTSPSISYWKEVKDEIQNL